jgi:hypothetical protein
MAKLKAEISILEQQRYEAPTQDKRDELEREIQDKMSILDCWEEYCS